MRVAIAGFGAIGAEVARRLDAGDLSGLTLTAVAARDREKLAAKLGGFATPPAIVPLPELAERADVVVECLPPAHFRLLAEPVLAQGRILMPLSVGALLDHWDLVALARTSGGRIVVPSGAILGLDAIRAVAEGQISHVRIVTRKPPAGLEGAPLLTKDGQTLAGLAQPVRLFAGTVREAIRAFPANVNVAVAVALAGLGPDKTEIEVWADPAVLRNTHTVVVASDSSHLTMTIENTPSIENPRTGTITALSVVAALRRLTSPLVVGT